MAEVDHDERAFRARLRDFISRVNVDEIARRSGVSTSSIYRWVDDHDPREPGVFRLARVLHAGGSTVAKLMGEGLPALGEIDEELVGAFLDNFEHIRELLLAQIEASRHIRKQFGTTEEIGGEEPPANTPPPVVTSVHRPSLYGPLPPRKAGPASAVPKRKKTDVRS